MKRRRFFTASAAGMATLAVTGVTGVAGCTSSPGGGSAEGGNPLPPFEFEEMGVARLGEMMASGSLLRRLCVESTLSGLSCSIPS